MMCIYLSERLYNEKSMALLNQLHMNK